MVIQSASRPIAREVVPIGREGCIFIGTSGWTYRHWRGVFFPKNLPHSKELEFLANQFETVEVNGTFYSLTTPKACAKWRAAAPPGFIFSIKGSRYITHMLKLRNCEKAMANFFASGVLTLGAQLGPILWQLPPQLHFDAARARAFFAMLPRNVAAAERRGSQHDERVNGRCILKAPDGNQLLLRHALEIRHDSWLTSPALALMKEYEVALVAADTAGRYPEPVECTTDFVYVRLHGSGSIYAGKYRPDQIQLWASRIRAWRAKGIDAYVYFDNDAKVHAPDDANALIAAMNES